MCSRINEECEQGWAENWVPVLVNFVPAVASTNFALLEKFSQHGADFIAQPSRRIIGKLCHVFASCWRGVQDAVWG